MNVRKIKGFTLVELLAVIVILAIILAIAVPSITGITNTASRDTFIENGKLIIKAIEYKALQDSSFDPTTLTTANIETQLSGVSASNIDTINVTKLNGKPYVVISGKSKWDNLVVAGSYDNIKVTDTTSSSYVNPPMLVQGMIPIKWNGTAWVETTVNDTSWYSYDTTNKQWANAKTADGSMWVWIPRYVYRVTTNWHSNTTGTIDVQFSIGTDDTKGGTVTLDTGTTSNASNNKWTNHPAFTFGTLQLTGIWVAKFEATAAEGVANGYIADGSCPSGADNVTTKTIKSIPNITSWRCIQIGNMFTVTRNMETNSVYGWGTGIDTHLMKNVEWGAVAYLSKSTYGQNTNEIWINPADNYTTGCAGDSATSSSTTGCLRTYETTNGVKASTTGTIYGIYDISGGSWEYVSAYVNNGNGSLNANGASIVSATAQYKDLYTAGGTDNQANNYALAINLKGDAVYETSNAITDYASWFSDFSIMVNTGNPWFLRGGRYLYDSASGAFNFYSVWGGTSSSIGFRPVLVVGAGL
jgi:type IV pilus assembly protein PilA